MSHTVTSKAVHVSKSTFCFFLTARRALFRIWFSLTFMYSLNITPVGITVQIPDRKHFIDLVSASRKLWVPPLVLRNQYILFVNRSCWRSRLIYIYNVFMDRWICQVTVMPKVVYFKNAHFGLILGNNCLRATKFSGTYLMCFAVLRVE